MKIALITYYYSCNNGAVMQTYALCRYLKECGHEVELIDVRQKEPIEGSLAVKIIKPLIFRLRFSKILRNYYPKTTKRYLSIDELQKDPPLADCYIVGSDQVWNPKISKELRDAFFLDFGTDNVRRISYASSFGLSEWPNIGESETMHIKDLLHRFNSVAVRERQGADICRQKFGIDASVVLDPTFLNDNYDEFNQGVKQTDEFVCYKLNRTVDFWGHIQKVASLVHSKPLLLNYNFPKKGYKYCFPPSLRTWMRKLAGAKFIVTDSFHGIAFSIINRKQFVAILNDDGLNSRLINLMQTMGLEDRIYPSVEEMLTDKRWMLPIDYSLLENRIAKEIEYSRQYLKKALK